MYFLQTTFLLSYFLAAIPMVTAVLSRDTCCTMAKKPIDFEIIKCSMDGSSVVTRLGRLRATCKNLQGFEFGSVEIGCLAGFCGPLKGPSALLRTSISVAGAAIYTRCEQRTSEDLFWCPSGFGGRTSAVDCPLGSEYSVYMAFLDPNLNDCK